MGGYNPYGGDRIADLMQQRGQITAQGAAQRADMWGNALGNIGQIAGQYGAQYAEQQKQQQQRAQVAELAKRDAAVAKSIETWDGKDPNALYKTLLGVGGPKIAQEYTVGAVNFRDMTDKNDAENEKRFDTVLQQASRMPDPLLQRFWPGMRTKVAPAAKHFLGIEESDIPGEVTPEFKQIIQQLAEARSGEKGRGGVVVPSGGSLVNSETGAAMFTNQKPETVPNVGSFEDFVVRKYGAQPSPEQITQARKEYQQADDRPININTGQRPMSQTMEANVINRLSGQWQKSVAPVVELDRQVKLMDVGLAEARKGNLAQGAQTVLVTFQKILDPPSVVRESEYARSSAGLAMTDRVRGAYEKLIKGGAGVPVEELEKFANLARQAAKAQAAGYSSAQKDRIGKTADRYNIPRELVFEDFDFSFGGGPTQGGGAGGSKTGGAPVRLGGNPDAEYAALPKGTPYIGPDGIPRVK